MRGKVNPDANLNTIKSLPADHPGGVCFTRVNIDRADRHPAAAAHAHPAAHRDINPHAYKSTCADGHLCANACANRIH